MLRQTATGKVIANSHQFLTRAEIIDRIVKMRFGGTVNGVQMSLISACAEEFENILMQYWRMQNPETEPEKMVATGPPGAQYYVAVLTQCLYCGNHTYDTVKEKCTECGGGKVNPL